MPIDNYKGCYRLFYTVRRPCEEFKWNAPKGMKKNIYMLKVHMYNMLPKTLLVL